MGGRRRLGATAVAMLAAAVALLAPAAATADVGGAAAGAALNPLAGSGLAAATWTATRRQAAEPLATELSAGADGLESVAASAASTGSPEARSASPVAKAATPQTKSASIEGVDTGSSTLYPNRANGKVYGIYVIRGREYEYECSGSVIDSPHGDVVLTAGHCVIDPESGAVARDVVFVPGYREKAEPYGVWTATNYATTETWEETAGTRAPNEGGDLAFLVLADNSEGADVEEKVGSLKIAFDQARLQTYTQYGYPAEEPYDGEILYSNTTAYAGTDTNDPLLTPSPIRIASDFTAGSSGGPWTIGSSSAPTVVSLTDYGYEEEPGYIYGAYFGNAARGAYEVASGTEVAAGIEDGGETATGATTSTGAAAVPATVSPTTRASSGTSADELRIRSVRRHPSSGTATITVVLGGGGILTMHGGGVWTASQEVGAAGVRRLTVRAKGSTARKLIQQGSAIVSVRLTFATITGTRHLSRTVRLLER